MRSLALFVVVVAALAASGPTMAAKPRAGPTPKVPVVCTSSVAKGLKDGTVSVGARCAKTVLKTVQGIKHPVAKKVVVPGHALVMYQSFDNTGAICGATPQRGKLGTFAVVPAGAYKVVITVQAGPNSKQYRVVSRPFRPVSLTLGGTTAMCGQPASPSNPKGIPLPPPEVLCPGGDSQSGAYCGTPLAPGGKPAPDACAWTGVPTMSGNIVTAGRLVCPAGNCWIQQAGPLKSFTWLGSTVYTAELRCQDGTYSEIALEAVSLANSDGQSCGPFRPIPPMELASFTVPSNWGGELTVMWSTVTLKNNVQLGAETVKTTFRLGGSESGCPQLEKEGRPSY